MSLSTNTSASAWSSTDRSWASGGATTSAGNAQAGASIGAYTGVQAGVEAGRYEHDTGEMHLGLAVDTGVGYKDGSLEIKFLGTGFTLGNNTGISFLGSGFTAKNIFGWR